ncbi:unnamed protein product [Arctogadus glacialis]
MDSSSLLFISRHWRRPTVIWISSWGLTDRSITTANQASDSSIVHEDLRKRGRSVQGRKALWEDSSSSNRIILPCTSLHTREPPLVQQPGISSTAGTTSETPAHSAHSALELLHTPMLSGRS